MDSLKKSEMRSGYYGMSADISILKVGVVGGYPRNTHVTHGHKGTMYCLSMMDSGATALLHGN